MRRIGKFEIPYRFMKSHPKDCKRIFGKMLILRAESLDYAFTYEYIAESDLFDEVSGALPHYEITFYKGHVKATRI